MMDAPVVRKPRNYFDVAARPSHVTFDDGQNVRRNLPWQHYAEARWAYETPELIEVVIGDWLLSLSGHNLGPLYAAIEEQTLLRVTAHPDWDAGPARWTDSFVLQIRFMKMPSVQ